MSEKRFTSFIEDDGYWIRDERDFKIIATGLKFGVAKNLIAYLDRFNDENKKLKQENKKLKEEWEFSFRTEMAHHRFEEKELKEKIRKQQSTITELNKQNEQLRKKLEQIYGFKGLNCRCVR